MARPWVKSWTNALDTPKVLALPGDLYKIWDLLCRIAGRHDQDGFLPSIEGCAFMMHKSEEWLEPMIRRLIAARLIDETPDGLMMHDWSDWQTASNPAYPSNQPEAIRERVRRHRQRKRDVTSVTSGNDSLQSLHVTSETSSENVDVTDVTTDKNRIDKRDLKKEIPSVSPKKAQTTLDTFEPDRAMREVALAAGVDAEDIPFQTEQWRDYHRERNTEIKDFKASWRRWMRNAPKMTPRNGRLVTVNEQKLRNIIDAGPEFDRLVAMEAEANGQQSLQNGNGQARPRLQPGQQRGKAVSILAAPQQRDG